MNFELIAEELPVMLTSEKAAEITGLSKRTLANKRCLGEPPYYIKQKRRVLYPRTEFIAWLELISVEGKSPKVAE